MLRRMHGIEVGQSRELLVGETARQLIEEVDDGAGMCSLALVDLTAFVTGAVGVVAVILAH